MTKRTIRMGGCEVVVSATPTHAAFWDLVANGGWEPGTLGVIERLLRPGSVYVDVGAWIGPTVLCAAATGASVLAFEPDPIAFAGLRRNLALNPDLATRVRVHALAVFDHDGEMPLTADDHGLGQSVSTLVRQAAVGGTATVSTADGRRIAEWPEFAACSLLKIDIEGGEYRLLPRLLPYLRARRPPLLLSVHGVHWRSRFARVPRRPRRLLQLIGSANQRALLLWRLRMYRHVAASDGRTEFRELARRDRLRLLLDLAERDLFFSVEG